MRGAVVSGALIVGASHAGIQLASSLREKGYGGAINVVSEESALPYDRPPLTKSFLQGKTEESALALRSRDFYSSNSIDVTLDGRIVGIDLESGTAVASEGNELTFEHLALTTGASVRALDVPGSDLDNICYMRTLDDARRLKVLLDRSTNVVVVGGGFIGLEAAAVARELGKSVTVVEVADRLIERAVAPVVSEFYAEAHRRRGVDVVLTRSVVTFQEGAPGSVGWVVLDDGTELRADLVVVGIGVLPRTELAAMAGLELDGGIVVDEHTRTSDHRVVAAGDCTVFTLHDRPGVRIRLESVQNAVDQAKVAASAIAGTFIDYRPVPWFWSYQADLKLQIAGYSAGFDEVVIRGEPESERFSALYFRDDRLVAADCINRSPDYVMVRRTLEAGKTLSRLRCTDPDVSLKECVEP